MNLQPFGQLAAQLMTVIAIDANAKTPADKFAAAQVALGVAAAFKTAGSGDVVTALSDIQSAIVAKVTDPGQAALVTALFQAATPFLLAAAQANSGLPLISATVQGAANEIAAGITAAASAYPDPAAAAKK